MHAWFNPFTKATALVGLACFAAVAAWAQAVPQGRGQELVATLCNSCHVLQQRIGAGYTPQGWNTVMRMMTNHGLNVSDQDVALMSAYLVSTYPERVKPAAVIVTGEVKVTMQAWQVGTPGSRPHDPLATRDGMLWYTGQMTNKLGRINPATNLVTEFEVKTPHSGPHGLMEDKQGNIW